MKQMNWCTKRFGEKLRLLRQGRGLTLTELAAATGLKAHGYISELEAGKKQPSVQFVISIARYFDVSTDELLLDEKELASKNELDVPSNGS